MGQIYNKPEVKMPSMGRTGRGGGPGRFGPKEKPKNVKGTLIRIVNIYMRWGKTIVLAMFLTVISSFIVISIPYFVGRTFNYFNVDTRTVNIRMLLILLIIILVLHLSNFIISSVNGVIMLKVSQKLVHVLRTEFFKKMQHLPLEFYDMRSHGDTMSRITNDVDNISSTIKPNNNSAYFECFNFNWLICGNDKFKYSSYVSCSFMYSSSSFIN